MSGKKKVIIPSLRSFFAHYKRVVESPDWEVYVDHTGCKNVRLRYLGQNKPIGVVTSSIVSGRVVEDFICFCPITAVIFELTGRYFRIGNYDDALKHIGSGIKPFSIVHPADGKFSHSAAEREEYTKESWHRTREILLRPLTQAAT